MNNINNNNLNERINFVKPSATLVINELFTKLIVDKNFVELHCPKMVLATKRIEKWLLSL